MHSTVWKYELPRVPCFTLELPLGAEFLCVQMQHDVPVAWFRVRPIIERKEVLEFSWCLTGDPCPCADQGIYRGTILLQDGHVVMHLFEKLVQSEPLVKE